MTAPVPDVTTLLAHAEAATQPATDWYAAETLGAGISDEDAAYIAACSPDTIKALIERLQRAESKADDLEGRYETAHASRMWAEECFERTKDAEVEVLEAAAQDAYERGDIGKEQGVEAWDWLRVKARLARDPEGVWADGSDPRREGYDDLVGWDTLLETNKPELRVYTDALRALVRRVKEADAVRADRDSLAARFDGLRGELEALANDWYGGEDVNEPASTLGDWPMAATDLRAVLDHYPKETTDE